MQIVNLFIHLYIYSNVFKCIQHILGICYKKLILILN